MKASRKESELRKAPRQYSIGDAAELSGVSAKMIRHYESVGLLRKIARTAGNYRLYSENDVHALNFVRRARELGFSMKEIQVLLSLWGNRNRSSAQVRRLAMNHVADLKAKITELQGMVRILEQLAHNCHGDDRPDCPILDDLASPPVRGGRDH